MLESGTGGVHRHHARTLLPHCPAQLSPLPLSLLGGAAPDSLLDEQLLSLALALPLLLSRGLDGHGRGQNKTTVVMIMLIMILILIVIMVMITIMIMEMHSMNIMMVVATR